MTLRLVALAATAIALTSSSLPARAGAGDPVFNGRPLSYWLEGLTDEDLRVRAVSGGAVLAIAKDEVNRPVVRRKGLDTLYQFVEQYGRCWSVSGAVNSVRKTMLFIGPDHRFVPWIARCLHERVVGVHEEFRAMMESLGRDARAAAPLVSGFIVLQQPEHQPLIEWIGKDRSVSYPLSASIVRYLKDRTAPKRRDWVDRLVISAVNLGGPDVPSLAPEFDYWVRRGDITPGIADWAATRLSSVKREIPTAPEDQPLIGKWRGISPPGEVWREAEFLPRSQLRVVWAQGGDGRGTFAADRHGLIGVQFEPITRGMMIHDRALFLEILDVSEESLRLRIRQYSERDGKLEFDPKQVYEYRRVVQ
jgi:hypothetical protein